MYNLEKSIGVFLLFLMLGFTACDNYDDLKKEYIFIPSRQYLFSQQSFYENIYPDILDYVHDDDFLLICQRPNYKEHLSLIAEQLPLIGEYYGRNKGDKETEGADLFADSLLRNDPMYTRIFFNKLNYWIFLRSEKKLIGPLTKSDYFEKRKKFRIPDRLTLKYCD